MIPSEVVIVAKPKSKGIKTAQEKPKVAISKPVANTMAIN